MLSMGVLIFFFYIRNQVLELCTRFKLNSVLRLIYSFDMHSNYLQIQWFKSITLNSILFDYRGTYLLPCLKFSLKSYLIKCLDCLTHSVD